MVGLPRDLRPDRVRDIEVLVDGEWLSGDLEAVDMRAGLWRGFVRYSRGPGRGITSTGGHPLRLCRVTGVDAGLRPE